MVWLIQLVELVKFGQVVQRIHLDQLIDSAGPVCLASSVGSSESVISVGSAGFFSSFPYS